MSDYFFCLKPLRFLFDCFSFCNFFFFFGLFFFRHVQNKITNSNISTTTDSNEPSHFGTLFHRETVDLNHPIVQNQTRPRRHWHIPTVCSSVRGEEKKPVEFGNLKSLRSSSGPHNAPNPNLTELNGTCWSMNPIREGCCHNGVWFVWNYVRTLLDVKQQPDQFMVPRSGPSLGCRRFWCCGWCARSSPLEWIVAFFFFLSI